MSSRLFQCPHCHSLVDRPENIPAHGVQCPRCQRHIEASQIPPSVAQRTGGGPKSSRQIRPMSERPQK
jgi:hypothetical protein